MERVHWPKQAGIHRVGRWRELLLLVLLLLLKLQELLLLEVLLLLRDLLLLRPFRLLTQILGLTGHEIGNYGVLLIADIPAAPRCSGTYTEIGTEYTGVALKRTEAERQCTGG